jgi:hypothetical protein
MTDEAGVPGRDWFRFMSDLNKQVQAMQADVTKLKTLMNTLIPGSFP